MEAPVEEIDEATLAALQVFTNAAELTTVQLDSLVTLFLAGTSHDRRCISRLYPRLFNNAAFVQKIATRIATIEKANNKAKGSPTNGASNQTEAAVLKAEIFSSLAVLSGEGPFMLRLGSANCPTSVSEVIQLFSQQFTNPPISDLKRMIRVKPCVGTKTRRNLHGSCVWTVADVANNTVVCAANCEIHKCGTLSFVEVPLFATKSGYLKQGIARLLIAAIKDYVIQFEIEYIVVSADPGAVPFWTSQGFSPLVGALKGRILTEYKDACQEFIGSQLLVWPSTGDAPHVKSYVQLALASMPNFKVEGTLGESIYQPERGAEPPNLT